MWWRRLRAREVGVVDVVGAVAKLEDRGTAGGSTACLHIITIRIVSHTSLITTFSIISLTIAIIRM